jgi:hypothetical protein
VINGVLVIEYLTIKKTALTGLFLENVDWGRGALGIREFV